MDRHISFEPNQQGWAKSLKPRKTRGRSPEGWGSPRRPRLSQSPGSLSNSTCWGQESVVCHSWDPGFLSITPQKIKGYTTCLEAASPFSVCLTGMTGRGSGVRETEVPGTLGWIWGVETQKGVRGVVINIHSSDEKWYTLCFSLCVKHSIQVVVCLQILFN